MIRPLALAVVRNDGLLLVYEGHDSVKAQTFYRLLGGGIEFGELGEQAVRRELLEEIGVEIATAKLLGVLENIFVYEGGRGHELCLIYDVELAGAIPATPFTILDSDAAVVWIDPGSTGPVYPDGLLELLSSAPTTR